MDKNLEILIEMINTQLEVLFSHGYKVYDIENPEFFINSISYDSEADKLVFETERDNLRLEDKD